METIKKEKTFDAVKMMREIRDKISAETKHMTFEELKAYTNKNLSASQTKIIEHPSIRSTSAKSIAANGADTSQHQ
jgi:hypothetical protein